MKTFWKILGLGALAAGLTPYKVEKNEETGESSYQALLWRISISPGSEENKKNIDINLGEGTLTSKLTEKMAKKEEAHLFSDELSVEYDAAEDDDEATDAGEDSEEDAAEDANAAMEEAAIKVVEETADADEESKEE